MVEEKSKIELYIRITLRTLVCVLIGVAIGAIMAFVLLVWTTMLFPMLSSQVLIFTRIFIYLSFFSGGLIAGHLSITFKRSIVTSICIALILAIASFLAFNTLFAAMAAIFSLLGGLIGGGIIDYLKETYFSKPVE